ncbi:MAG: acetyl-CoA carboxylase biotin carboxyl carrier protein [Culicoidibacterales bacterium]
MQIENVEAYIQLLNENELSELKLKTEEFELHIKKDGGVMSTVVPATPVQQVAPVQSVPQQVETDIVSGVEVKSPIVGVVYLSPEPGKAPYVCVGEHVKKGQKLAIISAMKVMNDFVSPVDGVIKDIRVQNEDVVAFDQVLFIIE